MKKLMMVIALALLTGCSGLASLNPNLSAEQQATIMKQENARGCIYFRGNAAPFANVSTLIVGTWGSDPPAYADCWKELPSGF